MSEHIRDIAQEYHAAYCEATGLKIKYTFEFYADWFLFAKQFEPGDIATVVRYLKVLYKDKPDILAACLRIRKLIKERASFAEYLAEAQAKARIPKETPRDRALAAAGMSKDKTADTAEHVGAVSARALEIMAQFKKEQGMV